MIEFRPLSTHVGAEVTGIDVGTMVDESAAAALRQALSRCRLLLFRQPGLSQDAQIRFTEIFGQLYSSKAYKSDMGGKGYYFSNTREDGQVPTGELSYHHDHLFNERPCKAGVLYAMEIPASGSATKFRDSVVLADRMPADLRERARGVKCLHMLDYADVSKTGRVDHTAAAAKARRAWQPLLWTQPETGKQALWVVPLTTVDFSGIERADGDRLLSELWDYAEQQHDLEYAHAWKVGDLLIWDNLLLCHARAPFEPTEGRTLRRTTVFA